MDQRGRPLVVVKRWSIPRRYRRQVPRSIKRKRNLRTKLNCEVDREPDAAKPYFVLSTPLPFSGCQISFFIYLNFKDSYHTIHES